MLQNIRGGVAEYTEDIAEYAGDVAEYTGTTIHSLVEL